MSRLIPSKPTHEEDAYFRSTGDGKLIITEWEKRQLGFLIRNNRLLQVLVPEERSSQVGAVYLGKVKQVVHNIDACFVEISDKELVFLPFSQCKTPFLTNRLYDGRILEGDEILIQIEKDAVKTKQASATTKITLAGRYTVFSTGSVHAGISGKVSSAEKESLRNIMLQEGMTDAKGNWIPSDTRDASATASSGLMPPSYGVVIRTEATELTREALLKELIDREQQFLAIFRKAIHCTCFTCLSAVKSPWEAVLEQIPAQEYSEVVTDHPDWLEKYAAYFSERNIATRLYQDDSYPLKKLYSIDTRLKEALERRIWLKSGAYLVFDTTEALNVFDVNSGKYEAHKASEEAAFRINMEAAEEIALQLRLRNLSGIILVDFISMKDDAKQNALLEYMRRLISRDHVHTSAIDITPLGLMEITRRKINKPLAEYFKREVSS